MVIRCKTCHGAVWIETGETEVDSTVSTCPCCKQRYEFAVPSPAAMRRLSNEARRLARDEGIDLPAAYSVALGAMSLARVRETSGPPPVATDAGECGAKGDLPAFDPAFTEAVESGQLTRAQAAARGRRASCAALLATRHELPLDTAFSVADNRTSLLQALREEDTEGHEPVSLRVKRRSNPLRRGIWIALGLLTVAAAAAAALRGGPPPVGPLQAAESRTVGAAEVQTDQRGRIVRILGPGPRSVLAAYCASVDPFGHVEPLGIAPPTPAERGVQLGVFRGPGETAVPMAIRIVEDRATGRWVAGDGWAFVKAVPATSTPL